MGSTGVSLFGPDTEELVSMSTSYGWGQVMTLHLFPVGTCVDLGMVGWGAGSRTGYKQARKAGNLPLSYKLDCVPPKGCV